MFGFFKKNNASRLEKKLQKKYETAMEYQRSGKLKEYGEISAEIQELEKEIDDIPEP